MWRLRDCTYFPAFASLFLLFLVLLKQVFHKYINVCKVSKLPVVKSNTLISGILRRDSQSIFFDFMLDLIKKKIFEFLHQKCQVVQGQVAVNGQKKMIFCSSHNVAFLHWPYLKMTSKTFTYSCLFWHTSRWLITYQVSNGVQRCPNVQKLTQKFKKFR